MVRMLPARRYLSLSHTDHIEKPYVHFVKYPRKGNSAWPTGNILGTKLDPSSVAQQQERALVIPTPSPPCCSQWANFISFRHHCLRNQSTCVPPGRLIPPDRTVGIPVSASGNDTRRKTRTTR